MGIKRGVSLYSYQQTEWFGKMTWKDELREVATNLGGATGIEIISEATIPQYPMPPESFFFDWNNEIARWGLIPVTMDTYLDTRRFVDHVMTYAEAAECIKYDLRIAKKMGFQNIRLVHNIPFEAIELALPLAEELDVRMTNEIHAPGRIRPRIEKGNEWCTRCAEDIAFAKRHNTKHYGVQPDMGIFQNKPCRLVVTGFMRNLVSNEEAEYMYDEMKVILEEQGRDGVEARLASKYSHLCDIMTNMLKSIDPDRSGLAFLTDQFAPESCAEPVELFDIAPYIYCIHGKFYEMTEMAGKPGQYEDSSIQYKEVIDVLKGIGYDGYINSEYEGQRSQQDQGDTGLADEIEEVRRHHEMMKRLIGA